jgi:hypothetical protein
MQEVMKTLGWSENPWYLANYDSQNRVFYKLTKHLTEKIIIILSQNFKNILFPNTS